MARDDIHIIIYKFLAYLYDCMKKGKAPDRSELSCDGRLAGGIPERYWSDIWCLMRDNGLVSGVGVSHSDNGRAVILKDPSITLAGIEFMHENTMMQRALKVLRDAKATVPGL